MATAEKKQHVPVFVGSTYTDMLPYREATLDVLHRLETVVRGMEYFGSKPGRPLAECLSAVASSKVYIGIFGMRYGFVPDGSAESITHLEYLEAQRRKIPTLVYLIDEQNQPVLPIHIETGEGADRLSKLKEHLRKTHVISTFTTPEDLASKILADLPPALTTSGAHVEGGVELMLPEESARILERFSELPARYRNREVTIEFTANSRFRGADVDDCSVFNLSQGGTVRSYEKTNGGYFYLYGEGQIAERLMDLPKGARVWVRARTVFGVKREVARDSEWTDEGPVVSHEALSGLAVKEILDVKVR